QPGRRTWRSWAAQTFGAAKTLRTVAAAPEAASACGVHREYRITRDESVAHRAAATALLSDCGSGASSSHLCNVLLFLRSVTAYADRPNHFSLVNNGDTTLQRCCPRQRQRSYATVAHLIFKHFAWASENRGRSRFTNANLNTRNLCIVESFQQQQMTAV